MSIARTKYFVAGLVKKHPIKRKHQSEHEKYQVDKMANITSANTSNISQVIAKRQSSLDKVMDRSKNWEIDNTLAKSLHNYYQNI